MNIIPDGIRPPNGTHITPTSHPSVGGNAYSDDTRQAVLNMWLNGDDLYSPALNQLRQQKKFPCIKTCQNWIAQYTLLGHVHPKRATGNH